jgi:outer membrane protein
VLLAVLVAVPATAERDTSELGLRDAVREAVAANLDLAAQRRSLAADREEIGVARSNLLPQVDLAAKTSVIDGQRSHDGRGTVTKRSTNLGAKLTQVLYDDESWAGYRIQESVYEGQQAEYETFELGVVQDAATTFLELDRSTILLAVRERNRGLTAKNLKTSLARIAAGYSSEREVLRWQSQLAENDQSVVDASTAVLTSRFEMNRFRNLSAETAIDPLPATIEEYGFVYARPRLVAAIASAEGDRQMRDTLSRIALARSPELAVIAAAIRGAERERLSRERAFWVPTLTFGAGVSHLEAHGDDPDFNQTEWGLGLGLEFPLVQGGAKIFQLDQSREGLESLGLQRRSIAQQLDQGVRAAFGQASGSYKKLGFAQAQVSAASRNFELVSESYQLGVASILSLLDAQSQLLSADEAAANAHYDFLEDLIAAERALSFYPFLQLDLDVERLLDQLEREITPGP